MKIFKFLTLVGLIGFVGCNETKDVTLDSVGGDYYPIKMGTSRIYRVKERVYNPSDVDVSHYQIRETVFDAFSSRDRITYLLRRERRSDDRDPWVSDSVWTVTKNTNFLSVSENNIPFTKLVFPVRPGDTWDGHGLNARPPATYRYERPERVTIDSLDLEDHIRVVISDVKENVVNRDEKSELYVRGIGLVRKNYVTLNFCTSGCDQPGQIQSGRFLEQVLTEISNE